MATYLKPAERKEQILKAAMVVAAREGYLSMMRREVAVEAGCANGTVSRYFNTMDQLRRAVMRRAVHVGNLVVLSQGLANKNKQAMKASDELKQAAATSLTE